MNMDICKVADTDMLERCLSIRYRVFSVEKGVPREVDVDANDCLQGPCTHFLIRYQNADAGTIRCLRTANGIVRVQRFCFLKAYRGLGLGKQVMAYVEDYFRTQGFSVIEMDAKYDVCGFYEKCGYKIVSDVFMEVNIKHVKMMKELKPK